MRKKLIKHGNSMALVLTPVHGKARRKAFRDALEKVNRKYAADLKKLAE